MDSNSNAIEASRAVTLLDCTLRDGGYINGHDFSDIQIANVLTGLVASGVDVIEVGYFRRRNLERRAQTIAQCPRGFLAKLERFEHVRYGVMIPSTDVTADDLDELADLPVSVVRFTCSEDNVSTVTSLAQRCKRLGLQICANITRVSELDSGQLARLTRVLAAEGFDAIYAADSNGALYPADVTAIVETMREQFPGALGFHAHDSLHLAVANALAAMSAGASWIDGTVGGVGKGGGNAPMEVLLAQLSKAEHRRINIADFIQMPAHFPHDFFPTRFKEKLDNVVYAKNNLNIDKIKILESRQNA